MAEIQINGIIGDMPAEGNVLNGESMNQALATIPAGEAVVVKINSAGGSVFEGFAMYNQLKALPNPVTTEINGMAASIASLIALAGTPVKMSQVSMFMIHRASTMAMGNKEELEKQVDILESIDNTLISVYTDKTGKSREEIEEMMDKETWLQSNEALDEGFVDEIINKVDAKMAAVYQVQLNNKMMKLKDYWNQLMNADEEEGAASTEVVEEQTQIEDPELVDPEAKKKAEDDDPEKKKEPEQKYVTQAEFNKLKASVEKLAAKMDNNVEEQVVEKTAEAMEQLKTGLKKSTAQPPKANASVSGDPTAGWVDPYARHRAEMKEIEEATRQ